MNRFLTGLSIGVSTLASVLYATWSGIVGMLAVMIDGRSVGTVSLTVKEVITRSIGTVTSTMVLMFGFRKRLVETMLTEGSLNLPSVAAFGKVGSRCYAALLLRVVWSMVSRGPCCFPGYRIVMRRR